MKEKTFLGIGWSFPPTFNKESSDVKMVSDETDIKESLEIYFNTKLGERIMRPSYGCVIHEHIFDLSLIHISEPTRLLSIAFGVVGV
mgnify:CR=1 FL=1